MKKINIYNALLRICSVFFLCALLGCGSTGGSVVSEAGGSVMENDFVSLNEFCKARTIHVETYSGVEEMLRGSCFIADQTGVPVVSAILKRALKSQKFQLSNDKDLADYVLEVSLEQKYIRRRTYSTLKIVLRGNKAGKAAVWTSVAVVSGRGSYPAWTYAASQAGAAMYNFPQNFSGNVNRRLLGSFHQRLQAFGD